MGGWVGGEEVGERGGERGVDAGGVVSVGRGEKSGIACLTCVCAKFGMDRRLVSIWVRTNHTLDMLVSHPLHDWAGRRAPDNMTLIAI